MSVNRNDRVIVSLTPADWKLLDGLREVFLADNNSAAVRSAIRFAAKEMGIGIDNDNDADNAFASESPQVSHTRLGARNHR